MADNIELNTGSGGSTLATDEDASGYHYQLVKLADGTADATTVIAAGNGAAANALRVTLPTDGTGVVGLNAGSNTIGEVTIGAATTAAGDLAKAEDAAHASGDVGVMALGVRKATPADLSGTDGDYEPLQVDNGKLWVQAGGSVAHDSAVGSNDNPILNGAVAYETDGTAPGTAVAEGDITRLKADLDGRLLVNDAHPYSFNATTNGSTATTTVLQAAAGSGLHIYITDILLSAGGAQDFKIQEDTAGTPVDIVELIYLAANSTWSHTFKTPLRVSDNVNIGVVTGQAQAYSCTVSGYIAP